jgi:hypothetical protein
MDKNDPKVKAAIVHYPWKLRAGSSPAHPTNYIENKHSYDTLNSKRSGTENFVI